MRVFLAGEGPTELGDWSKEAPYRGEAPQPGTLEALLRRVHGDFEVAQAMLWKRIPKYRSGEHRQPEQRTVLGLALRAKEAGCHVLAFVRDRDGDLGRQADLEKGLSDAAELFPALRIAGGMAVEETEAWILALLGERGSERHTDPKAHLAKTHDICATQAMCLVVESADLANLPPDALSLKTWLARARAALSDS